MTETIKAGLEKIIKEFSERPPQLEPSTITISQKWFDEIYEGKAICPCHGDYRHKEIKI